MSGAIRSVTSLPWKPPSGVTTVSNAPWRRSDNVVVDTKLTTDVMSYASTSYWFELLNKFKPSVVLTSIVNDSVKSSQQISVVTDDVYTMLTMYATNVSTVDSNYTFTNVGHVSSTPWLSLIPIIDKGTKLPYGGQFDELSHITKLDFSKSFIEVDKSNRVSWGYGLNKFLVGGSTLVPSNPDPDALEPPQGVIEHVNYEVFRVVNVVTIKETVSASGIEFDNFSVQRDIESFAWTVSFDVLTKASFELIRPIGRTLKLIEVDINLEKFTLVVAKASIQRRAGGVVYRCSGWSQTKLLADPYASKRSFTDTQARTAAQILDLELTGTGFTYSWNTTDWLIPIGVHSYQDKTPLGAILEVVNAIGGVIEPDILNKSFNVIPYYPVSPWEWATATVNRTMNERQFFEYSSETVPKQNPDGVYVYGSVGVKAVRAGLPGTSLLPDVVNKYITANIAGQERGRVEVGKNSFIERIPMTTYVDEFGIIKPSELIEFTDVDNNLWRGMVLSVKVDCSRIGTALTQTITVARFYDD